MKVIQRYKKHKIKALKDNIKHVQLYKGNTQIYESSIKVHKNNTKTKYKCTNEGSTKVCKNSNLF